MDLSAPPCGLFVSVTDLVSSCATSAPGSSLSAPPSTAWTRDAVVLDSVVLLIQYSEKLEPFARGPTRS